MTKLKNKTSIKRKRAASLIALSVGVLFAFTVSIIIEARLKSFYGEPLFQKMRQVLAIRINGIPQDPEKRARTITAIPNLFLLPPEAVLPKAPAERFRRIGTEFGYVGSDTKLGTRFECRKSVIKRIPRIAFNIAIALEHFPEDLLRRVHMDYVVFCGDLLVGPKNVAGFPAPPNNVMFLNLDNRTTDREIKSLFFHEFYHLFEVRFNLEKDPEWLKNFGDGYTHTYHGMMKPGSSMVGSGGKGFLNYYSRSHPHEDRAEIFAALMTSKPELIRYIATNKDYMLAAKTEYIAQHAKKYLNVDFGPLWTK